MGVPGFFLWLWKNYKKTNFVFSKSSLDPESDKSLLKQVNNLDYLLLDANCLIHPVCFKTLADNPNQKDISKLERKMRINVIEYIEKLINHVKPKKGIYLAIDGVAPVAKIKQQRSRRFKSVSDKKLWDNIKRKHEKEIPLFWNNSAITPGTKFMRALHNYINTWSKEYSEKHNIEIIYSSCNEPSEGEHKLLQFIRKNKRNKLNYKYVMYGLDADLIFLTLSTGLKNTFLLREAQQFDKKADKDALNFVSIGIMRQSIVEKIKYIIEINDEYNEENPLLLMNELKEKRIIDDFIFICYLMGNDFLPHLPSLDIYEGAVDYLIEKYVDVLVNNYNETFKVEYIINTKAKEKINQKIFNIFIDEIALDEEQILKENAGNHKKFFGCKSTDPCDKEIHRIENLRFKIKDPVLLGKDTMEEWKERYYKHYFHVEPNEIDSYSKNMVKHYMTGLKWVTEYYFDKCPSWNWYFPYDHPPFLQEISKNKINFKDIKFELGQPLLPYQQLLCVLPKESSYLLPKCLGHLMINYYSELSHLYPSSFEQDFINKKKYWMGIPNLPPLEIELVKKVYKKSESKLNSLEREINTLII